MKLFRWPKKKSLPALLLGLLIAWLSYAYYEGKVTKVVDGDTIHVGSEKIRLLGVNTPEMPHHNQSEQCFAREAKEFVVAQILHQEVSLSHDPLADSVDKYGRSLRYVSYKGIDINGEIIRQGFGFAYTRFKFSKRDLFKAYEDEARIHQRGLWARCEVSCKKNYCRVLSPK